MDAGADDYLVKPFTARELIARVRTHIALGRMRRSWATELERANRELEAFSYSVSHDLRAPLRAIDGFTALLGDEALSLDDRRMLLRDLRRSTQRMREITEDLLTLSQVSRGAVCRELVDVTVLSRRVLADLRLRDPGRVVDIQVSPGMTALADRRLLTLALENLIGNAWKFTSKRSRAEIAIECEGDGAFAVRDNGAGFDMAYSAQLFQPFERMHSADDFEGTGIGLAIVRRIIERHGGRAWAEAEIDRGATIRFTLAPPPPAPIVHVRPVERRVSDAAGDRTGLAPLPRWRAADGSQGPELGDAAGVAPRAPGVSGEPRAPAMSGEPRIRDPR